MKKLLTYVLTGMLSVGTGCTNQEDTTAKGNDQGAAAPVKTAEEIKTETIDAMIADMNLEEKVGQLLMCDFRSNADGSGMTVLRDDVAKKIKDYHLGGIILFAENLDTAEQTNKLVKDMQEQAAVPLLIGIDEEGGIVSRLKKSNIPHEIIPPAAEMKDTAQGEAAGRTIGEELAALGVNVDFAPIADVNTNPNNRVIGTRAFSSEADKAANMVAAFIMGLESTGVSGAAKHFPGHGDTATDSHNGEVFVTHTMERLREVEFVPFEAAISQGVDFVMVGHIKTPNATTDNMPASMSGEMMGVLRNELGYQGIAITDAMNMGAVTQYYGSGESAVLSVLAGMDIILMPADIDEAVNSLIAAAKSGRISEERLNESLVRILSLKYEKGLLTK